MPPLLKPQSKQKLIRIEGHFPEDLVKRIDHYGNFVCEHYGNTAQMLRADVIVKATERVLNEDAGFAEYMKSNPELRKPGLPAKSEGTARPTGVRPEKRD